MAVGRADHPELFGIGSADGFESQAALERFACILGLKNGVQLDLGWIAQVADVPGLVVGELVIGREEGGRPVARQEAESSCLQPRTI